MCANRALTDVEVEADVTQSPADIPAQTIQTRVRRIEYLDPQVIGLHLQTPRNRRLRFVSGQSVMLTVNKEHMAELPDKTVTTVLPTTGVREHAPGNFGQSDRIIQFPICQQTSVGSDFGTVKLKLQPTVKIKPQNPLFRFTQRVSHINTQNPPLT